MLQIKRYLDAYTASSTRGFPTVNLAYVQSLYEKTQATSPSLHTDTPQIKTDLSESDFESVTRLTSSIQEKLVYLLAAADLARSQWTQFEDEWMAIGLILLITSMVIYAVALSRALRFTHEVFFNEGEGSKMENELYELFPLKRMFLACGGLAIIAGGWKMNNMCFYLQVAN